MSVAEKNNMKLYSKPSCPYCKKVKDYILANSIQIEVDDTYNIDEVIRLGGKRQFPMLFINEAIYESDKIIQKLYEEKNKEGGWELKNQDSQRPEALIETPIKAGCPIGGTVLDPFFGAGTTGVVAKKQGKNCIGIELNKDYLEIAKKRINI